MPARTLTNEHGPGCYTKITLCNVKHVEVSLMGSIVWAWTGPSGANVDRWITRCLRSCRLKAIENVTFLSII
jgi:hypothetical protein